MIFIDNGDIDNDTYNFSSPPKIHTLFPVHMPPPLKLGSLHMPQGHMDRKRYFLMLLRGKLRGLETVFMQKITTEKFTT
jgi:valyl-tRNA synthetase